MQIMYFSPQNLHYQSILLIKNEYWKYMIDEIRDFILTVGCKPLVWVRPISFNQRGQYKTKPDFGTL